jgi:metallo-beta-lactamase family protein
LGSASVEVELAQARSDPLRILFSADIGPDCKLMHPDPEGPSGVDYLICESTYGDRDRIDATADRRRQMLCDEVRAAMHPHGALLIPSFAVERAQELISDLGPLDRRRRAATDPDLCGQPACHQGNARLRQTPQRVGGRRGADEGAEVTAPAFHRNARAKHRA